MLSQPPLELNTLALPHKASVSFVDRQWIVKSDDLCARWTGLVSLTKADD